MKLWLASEQRPDPRQQLTKRERLCQIVVSAGIESGNSIVYRCTRCQHHDGCRIAARTQFATDLKSVPAGQQHIKQDKIVIVNRGLIERRVAVGRQVDCVGMLTQTLGDHLRHAWLIFYQEDSQSDSVVQTATLYIAQHRLAAFATELSD